MAAHIVRLTLVLVCFAWFGCNRQRQAGQSATTAEQPSKSSPQIQWVDPKTIQPGPIRRDSLTAEQLDRVRRLQAVFADVDDKTVEMWVDDFKRDADPDRELAVWEAMAKAYSSYNSKHALTPDAKKDVFKVVLLRSMASEDDVLQRLELKVLTKRDAIEVMHEF